jgi:hypothetical protein
MAAVTVVYLILLPLAFASVVVAVLPLRPVQVRVVVLGLHALVSVALIGFMPGERMIWVMVFGPGLAIASIRLTIAMIGHCSRPPG